MTESSMLHEGRVRSDRLWPWYLASAIYLGIGVSVIYWRRTEFGWLWEPASNSSGRLQLNSIGDILAGFFAPLAFLWFFAATHLQRKELMLQRADLSDTRKVLDEQRLELERSAKESNAQTSIMQRTLESTMSRVIYDEFSINLYFFARECSVGIGLPIFVKSNSGGASHRLHFIEPEVTKISQIDPATVDEFLLVFHRSLDKITDVVGGDSTISVPMDYYINAVDVISATRHRIQDFLENPIYSGNKLVSARMHGLHFPELVAFMNIINMQFAYFQGDSIYKDKPIIPA